MYVPPDIPPPTHGAEPYMTPERTGPGQAAGVRGGGRCQILEQQNSRQESETAGRKSDEVCPCSAGPVFPKLSLDSHGK